MTLILICQNDEIWQYNNTTVSGNLKSTDKFHIKCTSHMVCSYQQSKDNTLCHLMSASLIIGELI